MQFFHLQSHGLYNRMTLIIILGLVTSEDSSYSLYNAQQWLIERCMVGCAIGTCLDIDVAEGD